MNDLIEDILRGAIKLALSVFERDHVQSILDAEYIAADALADAAEETKLHNL